MNNTERADGGQSMIFFALVIPFLLLMMGLVIEGGRLFVDYRHLQAAADTAALVGAQDLPCKSNGSETACISRVETSACRYAQLNSQVSCTPHGTSPSSANVPPLSCSPYGSIDYGNASTNVNCKQNAVPGPYRYVEVQLAQTERVPIFNKSFNLTVHAVAQHGLGRNFAVAILDPHQPKALEYNLSSACLLPPLCVLKSTGSVVVVGDQMSNSDDAHSINVDGDGTGIEVTCGGQWLTSADETTTPSGLASYMGGAPKFAPARCTGPSADSPTRFVRDVPPVEDPYASSTIPTGRMSTCTPCGGIGYAYTWGLLGRQFGHWYAANALPTIASENWEFFPGTYANGLTIRTGVGNIFFNPGVYTMGGNLSVKAGAVCIYGAPACDETLNTLPGVTGVKCWNASFDMLDPVYVLSSIWYHLCSPYGMWDSALPKAPPVDLSSVPTFDNGTPLNGVSFYMQNGTFDMETPSAAYLAAPNPCPGTGADTLLPIVSDAFPDGSNTSTSTYLYLPTSLAGQDALLFSGPTASHAGQVYPNVDYSVSEDKVCNTPVGSGNVWTGEFASTSRAHLHFLVFQRDASHGVTLISNGQQYLWGIVYNPGNYASGGGCASSCAVQISASTTSSVTTCSVLNLLSLTCAPPTIFGQIVADNASFSGTSLTQIYYRQSQSGGPGTALVQ